MRTLTTYSDEFRNEMESRARLGSKAINTATDHDIDTRHSLIASLRTGSLPIAAHSPEQSDNYNVTN